MLTYTCQTLCLGWHRPQWLGPPPSIINPENPLPTGLPPNQSEEGSFSVVPPSSLVTLGCHIEQPSMGSSSSPQNRKGNRGTKGGPRLGLCIPYPSHSPATAESPSPDWSGSGPLATICSLFPDYQGRVEGESPSEVVWVGGSPARVGRLSYEWQVPELAFSRASPSLHCLHLGVPGHLQNDSVPEAPIRPNTHILHICALPLVLTMFISDTLEGTF